MLTFNADDNVFQFRTAAVIIDADHILIHRASRDQFWVLPGGRVEMGETAAEALVREMQEEINTSVEVERLLYAEENFFTLYDKRYHEICFHFLTHLPDNSPYLDKSKTHHGIENDSANELHLIYQWFRLDELYQLDMPVYPEHLKLPLPEHPQHIITRE